MKEQIKAQKIELSEEEIVNLSDAEFKTLVTGCSQKWLSMVAKYRKKMKAMESGIKKNRQRTNSDRKEPGTQINDLEEKEEINIQPEQNEETRIKKKTRRGLGTSGTTLNIPTSES